MAKYRVLAPVTLYAGTLELTKAQSTPRLHCLEPLKKKTQFNIVEPVHFKVGETIGVVGKPDKALGQRLQLLDADGEPVSGENPPPPPPTGGEITPPDPDAPPPTPGIGEGEDDGAGDDNSGDGDLLKPGMGDSGDE